MNPAHPVTIARMPQSILRRCRLCRMPETDAPGAGRPSARYWRALAACMRRARNGIAALGPLQWALILGAIALIARLPLIFTSTSYVETSYLDTFGDTLSYVAASDDIVAGRGFESGGEYRTAGYPLFLTALRPLPGALEDAASVVQHLLGVGIVAVIVLVAWRWFGRATALLAGLLAAITPAVMTVEHSVLPDFLFGALVFGGTICLVEAVRGSLPSAGLLIATGVTFGLATHVKPTGQVLIAVVPLALAFATRDLRATLKGAAIAGAAMVIVVAPWIVRNTVQYGHPQMSIQGGHALFLRAFDLDQLPIPTDTPEGRLAKRVRDDTYAAGAANSYTTVINALGDGARVRGSEIVEYPSLRLTEYDAIQVMGDLALTAIRNHPWTYVEGTVNNLGRHLSGIGATNTSPGFDASRAFADDNLAEAGTPLPRRLATVPWRIARVATQGWWILSLHGAAALFLLFARDRRRVVAGTLIAVWVCVALATSLTNGVEARFALQLGPIVFILGSAGAALLVSSVLQAVVRRAP